MSALQPRHWQLLAALAGGAPQRVFALSKMLGLKPQQISGLWQQMPPHIRGLLRQHGGQWRLVRPLAVFDEVRVQQIAAAHGFQTALLNECPSSNDCVLERPNNRASRPPCAGGAAFSKAARAAGQKLAKPLGRMPDV